MEEALEDKQKTIELSLLGRLYLIDLENKTQVKKGSDEAGSVKLIKRDQTGSACRGVAGLAYR